MARVPLPEADDICFHIETARSLLPYVWACLEEARREFLPLGTPC